MQLYDTARRALVPFEPAAGPGGTVTMYTCGITPYDSAHVGHAATYLAYDVLQRRLRDMGYKTMLVRNVTDVDDDILRKARELGVHYLDLAAEEIARFDSDMGALGLIPAWSEPRATSAIAELGYGGRQGEHMVAVENTPSTHNLVVCTLCSCYPWPLLGLPPVWYKSSPYRSRAVIDPRGVLAEFGLALGEEVEIRVWDSTAEIRYLVLPDRPAGTEGLSEEALADLVSRDAMVGISKAASPGEVRR